MVVISCLFLIGAAAFVSYWVGRGVRLNRQLAIEESIAHLRLDPDTIVNMDTGEIVSSGTRRYERVKSTHSVRFE